MRQSAQRKAKSAHQMSNAARDSSAPAALRLLAQRRTKQDCEPARRLQKLGSVLAPKTATTALRQILTNSERDCSCASRPTRLSAPAWPKSHLPVKQSTPTLKPGASYASKRDCATASCSCWCSRWSPVLPQALA